MIMATKMVSGRQHVRIRIINLKSIKYVLCGHGTIIIIMRTLK